MGCDIHAYVEHKNGRKWESHSRFLGGGYRNYDVFGILAGVRNPIVPIAKPRGYPKDVSDFAKKASDEYGCDGHSHTWLTAREIIEWNKKPKFDKNNSWQRMFGGFEAPYVDANKDDIIKSFQYVIDQLMYEIGHIDESSKPDLDKYRVVMFFDN